MTERSKQDYKIYYEILNVIGKGAYGCVYKGKEKSTGHLRAIKVVEFDDIKQNLLMQYEVTELEEHFKACLDSLIKEYEIMDLISKKVNDNTVKCFEYFKTDENFVIIMELCDKNLSKLLTDKIIKEQKGFSEDEIFEIMTQLNKTFKIMSENNIIHRDLKLENILIKYKEEAHINYTVKLTDYGSSKRLVSLSRNYCNSNVGTLAYMAPELLKKEDYNYKCDLWTVGIIIYRLFFGRPPFSGNSEDNLIKNIEELGNNLKKTGNETLDDLIKKLLEKDPTKRINWNEYLNHPFFNKKYQEIKLIYEKFGNDDVQIFGKKFVENNKNNIELYINGQKSELVDKIKNTGKDNFITMIIKKKLTNLESMFEGCKTLSNINQLEYLCTKEVQNFSKMFSFCWRIKSILALINWDVSNGTDFSGMFTKCWDISNFYYLRYWNVSKGINFSSMFSLNEKLKKIDFLSLWNVSNGENFSSMFYYCRNLQDLDGLENWNVSKGKDFSNMFLDCDRIESIDKLSNWDVSSAENLSSMFERLEEIKSIEILENWDVSNCKNFSCMFLGCVRIISLKPLLEWDVSNGESFLGMFTFCHTAKSDVQLLKEWNISKEKFGSLLEY